MLQALLHAGCLALLGAKKLRSNYNSSRGFVVVVAAAAVVVVVVVVVVVFFVCFCCC